MIFSFLFIYIFVVNIVYYVVHIVCEVDVIANSLVLYLPFCSTLNKNFFSLLFSLWVTTRWSCSSLQISSYLLNSSQTFAIGDKQSRSRQLVVLGPILVKVYTAALTSSFAKKIPNAYCTLMTLTSTRFSSRVSSPIM